MRCTLLNAVALSSQTTQGPARLLGTSICFFILGYLCMGWRSGLGLFCLSKSPWFFMEEVEEGRTGEE